MLGKQQYAFKKMDEARFHYHMGRTSMVGWGTKTSNQETSAPSRKIKHGSATVRRKFKDHGCGQKEQKLSDPSVEQMARNGN